MVNGSQTVNVSFCLFTAMSSQCRGSRPENEVVQLVMPLYLDADYPRFQSPVTFKPYIWP